MDVSRLTLRNLVNVNDKNFVTIAYKWLTFAEFLTWGNVKGKFKQEWEKMFDLSDDESVKHHLGRFRRKIVNQPVTMMTKFLCHGRGVAPRSAITWQSKTRRW